MQISQHAPKQLRSVVADDYCDDESNDRVQPEQFSRHQDHRSADRDAESCCGISDGVKHHRLHVEVVRYVPED